MRWTFWKYYFYDGIKIEKREIRSVKTPCNNAVESCSTKALAKNGKRNFERGNI